MAPLKPLPWRRGLNLIVPATVFLLWWWTAGEDVEQALWRRYDPSVALFNITCSALLISALYVLRTPTAVADRLVRVMAVGLGVVLSVTVLELPALVFGHDYGLLFATREVDSWLQLATKVNRRDETLIHLHQPHSHYRGTVMGNLAWLGVASPDRYQVDVAYDHNGFRNDVDFERADVVAIGDSFVEAAETAQAKTAVAHLSRRLGVSVANLGQSNYGPQQELVVLERYGLPLSPKVVVWFLFGGNDLADVDAYEWERQHIDDLLAPLPLRRRLFTRNALVAFARLTAPARRVDSPLARRHRATFVRANGEGQVIYLDTNEEPWTSHQWEVASRTLLIARDSTRRIGAQFLVVYIPRKLRVYQGFLRGEPGAFAHIWKPNNLPDVVGAWCREHDIPFLDSTPPLRRAVALGHSVYLSGDVHWNAAGHAFVGAAVAERVQALTGLMPAVLGATQ